MTGTNSDYHQVGLVERDSKTTFQSNVSTSKCSMRIPFFRRGSRLPVYLSLCSMPNVSDAESIYYGR